MPDGRRMQLDTLKLLLIQRHDLNVNAGEFSTTAQVDHNRGFKREVRGFR